MNPILECRQLTKYYGNSPALCDFTLSLERGQITGLLGPNGSGKTTLIKLITGLLTPTSGEVLISGQAPGAYTKGIVSYLPDKSYLRNRIRIRDIIQYFTDFYENFIPQRAYEMLDSLSIDPNSRFGTLSKGTQEKVQLILVMSRKAELYILDEPIGGVDPAARDYILRTIINNYDENAAILISTHLISDIENILDRVLFLQNGKLFMNQSVDEIRETYGKSVDDYFREVFKC